MNIELHKPITGICKSWGLWEKDENNSISPLIYFKKTKYISQEKYEKIMNAMKIYMAEME